jgi:hypothetical protein
LKRVRSFGKVGVSFIDTPAAKAFSSGRDGRMLLLYPLPDSWGMLIDPDRWTARPLAFPDDHRLHDLLWAASDATLDGDRIWLISGSQLYELATEGWR